MTHVITGLCLRDGGCVTVCPVECIVPGDPQSEWPWFYIDPATCIDCGACVPECPFAAIFPEDEIPSKYIARGGEIVSMPVGTPGYDQVYEGTNYEGEPVRIVSTRALEADEAIDLTPSIGENARYFTEGPGYEAMP
ncbi:MAG: ferredoxin family protein [Chloroflexi bacterium]|nr:ferredoxin family protein [Chloroflexota bacterium]